MIEKKIIESLTINFNLIDNNFVELCQYLDETNIRDEYNFAIMCVETDSVYRESEKFASLNRDSIICANSVDKVFYIFYNGIWNLDKGNIEITRYIINFNEKYAKSFNFRNQFIHDLSLHSYIKDFDSRLSEFKAISLNKNVCFDYKTGNLRCGIPSDYMSITLDTELESSYKTEVIKLLKDIFSTDDVYKYFMRYISSLLVPGNNDKIFMIWSGKGNNGKSILARLIELTFKDYSVRLPTSLITRKRGPSAGATPELAMLKNKLIAFIQEPSFNESLNIGVVKELTGNDTIYVRSLYKNGTNIQLKAKIVYTVNSTDNIAVLEEAVWDRIVVLPFTTKFVNEPIEDHEKLKDIDLWNKLRLYTGSFLELLIDECKEYIKHGLVESITIKNLTTKVKLGNDSVSEYLALENSSTNYKDYVMYMREFYPGSMVPTLGMFNKKINN